MNGPEHYAEAERLIAECDSNQFDVAFYSSRDDIAGNLAAAQVHATLALVAEMRKNTLMRPRTP